MPNRWDGKELQGSVSSEKTLPFLTRALAAAILSALYILSLLGFSGSLVAMGSSSGYGRGRSRGFDRPIVRTHGSHVQCEHGVYELNGLKREGWHWHEGPTAYPCPPGSSSGTGAGSKAGSSQSKRKRSGSSSGGRVEGHGSNRTKSRVSTHPPTFGSREVSVRQTFGGRRGGSRKGRRGRRGPRR